MGRRGNVEKWRSGEMEKCISVIIEQYDNKMNSKSGESCIRVTGLGVNANKQIND